MTSVSYFISRLISTVMLAGRTPDRDVLLDNNSNAYLNFGGGINVVDPNSDATRPSTKADLAASAKNSQRMMVNF